MPRDLNEKNSEGVQSLAKVKAEAKKVSKEREEKLGQKILDLVRVSRVTAGGKKLRFRACIALGDKKGKVGMGVSKGSDVSDAVSKAVVQAQKNMLDLSAYGGVIPHHVRAKYKAGDVFLKPGKAGDGIIAGGIVRNVLELAGFHDVVAKKMGKGNNINTAKATLKALSQFISRKRPSKPSSPKAEIKNV
ncbi:MAG: 30S ribosomal protein S5 [Parcubacteria group bacterium]|nr:30S ribosomal protein S5 [Parcubacteria group bacterium]